MEELATTGTLHRFVPNVKFSRLQRSQRKLTVRNWTLG